MSLCGQRHRNKLQGWSRWGFQAPPGQTRRSASLTKKKGPLVSMVCPVLTNHRPRTRRLPAGPVDSRGPSTPKPTSGTALRCRCRCRRLQLLPVQWIQWMISIDDRTLQTAASCNSHPASPGVLRLRLGSSSLCNFSLFHSFLPLYYHHPPAVARSTTSPLSRALADPCLQECSVPVSARRADCSMRSAAG